MTQHTQVNLDAIFGRDDYADHLAEQVGEEADDDFAWADEVFRFGPDEPHLGQRLARALAE